MQYLPGARHFLSVFMVLLFIYRYKEVKQLPKAVKLASENY